MPAGSASPPSGPRPAARGSSIRWLEETLLSGYRTVLGDGFRCDQRRDVRRDQECDQRRDLGPLRLISVTARRNLGTGPEAPSQGIRAAQADLLDALPGIRLPDLGELRARGVLGAHPQRRRDRDGPSGLAARGAAPDLIS
ncbi:hypothetical protein OG978_44835 (plasmid) [Streptomyces sp. NBC_01591]|uniref:hypothetical protein n=1 Tax=Streptomyces sp. NBC_01591 TaxID=2975888 RepID=UPI002DDBA768|nr:hypothetical protein [Streptomyces sp. NBC_01591]WSD74235.1 hypothetical protein OG978_44835 [Streptomyces sp. NBC_01591]